jgi:hypothetical protein
MIEEIAYWLMMKLIQWWVDHHMDQFEKFTLVDRQDNVVYVSFSYRDDYPEAFNSFDSIDIGGHLE